MSARLRNGDLLEAVAEAEVDARGIVIGKRGEAADFAKLHLGSNMERIARARRQNLYEINDEINEERAGLCL